MLKSISLKAKPDELQGKWERLGFYAYFPLQCLVYFTKVLGHSANMFVGIPSNLLFIALSIKKVWNLIQDKSKNSCDRFVLFFVLWALFSSMLTILGGYPFTCIVTSLKIFILPILFYFWGRECKDTSITFYKTYVITCFFVMAIGLYLYITMPQFYSNYLYETYQNSWSKQGSEATENMIIDHHRFSSILSSSYSVCFFAVPSLAITLGFFLRRNYQFVFRTSKYDTWLMYLMVALFLVSSILCLQRIAMVYSVAIVLFYSLYGLSRGNKKLIMVLVALFLISVAYLSFHESNERDAQIIENLVVRLGRLNMDDAMGARIDQYSFIVNNWADYLVGTGLGSAGNKAAELGFNGVMDGEYYRMYAEQGILGIFSFLLIVIVSLIRGLKYFKIYNKEVVVISFFVLACIGANALSVNLWAGIFWYSVGRVWNKAYLMNAHMRI